MDWKLYYDDRSTFSSEDGSWLDAPVWGVLGLASPDKWVGREIDTGRPPGLVTDLSGDYYVWAIDAPKPWWVDMGGLMDFLVHKNLMTLDMRLSEVPVQVLIDAGVKFGRSIDNARWRELWPWVVHDADETFGGLDGERIPIL